MNEKYKNAVSELQTDIVKHIEKYQGVKTLEQYQKDICNAVVEHDRIAISACHCIGKTFTLAKVVLALGSLYRGAKIITTAPTHIQVEKLLWSEIRAGFRQAKSPLGGDMLNTEWKMRDDWFAIGMSPKDDAGSGEVQGAGSRFQGFHGDMVVIIFDEATGINPKRWIQAEGMMTSGKVKFIAIGNPTSKNTEFFKCFKNPYFKKIKLSCFDSPNLQVNNVNNLYDLTQEITLMRGLPDDEKIKRMKEYKIVQPNLLTLSWVVTNALRWGLDHPLFVSKALGQFPDEDDNALIKLMDVEDAQNRIVEESESERSIGVDPARFGSDSTVITVMEGLKQTVRKEMIKQGTTEITGYLVSLITSLPRKRREVVVIDGTGIGAGVVDQMKERLRERVIPDNIEIREVHFGSSCVTEHDKKTYFNLKAKLFHLLSQDIKQSLSILPHSVYLEELPAILYKFDSKGRYVIESKDEFKKRTGMGSPDSADSLALANYGRHSVSEVGDFTSDFVGDTDLTYELPDTIIGNSRW